MTLSLPIQYEQLLELVDQLDEDQQKDLLSHLLARTVSPPAGIQEKLSLLDALKLDAAISEAPSIRRADWYGDDGR